MLAFNEIHLNSVVLKAEAMSVCEQEFDYGPHIFVYVNKEWELILMQDENKIIVPLELWEPKYKS